MIPHCYGRLWVTSQSLEKEGHSIKLIGSLPYLLCFTINLLYSCLIDGTIGGVGGRGI